MVTPVLNWLASLRARIAAPSGRSLFHFSPGVAYLDAQGKVIINRRVVVSEPQTGYVHD